jgi:hypothetical protein
VDFDPSRLRRGEVIVGAGAVALLASMLALKWYGLSSELSPTASSLGLPTSVNGWHGLTQLRWLMLVAVVCGLALFYTQATRRAPAVPASLSVIVTVIGLVTSLALLYRVVINEPGPDSVIEQKAGAFVGLASAIAIFVGGFLSMREEGVAEADAPREIEVVTLDHSSPGPPTGEPQGS